MACITATQLLGFLNTGFAPREYFPKNHDNSVDVVFYSLYVPYVRRVHYLDFQYLQERFPRLKLLSRS